MQGGCCCPCQSLIHLNPMTYKYTFTLEIVNMLQFLERPRTEMTLTVLPPVIAEDLRLRARVRSAHFSTRIEGNRLTLAKAE